MPQSHRVTKVHLRGFVARCCAASIARTIAHDPPVLVFGAALVVIRHASTERLIVSSLDESTADAAGVRPGQVLTFFAVMWGLLFLVSTNLGTAFDIRGQLVIILLVMLPGGSLWFAHRHRLDYRQVFALWPARWPVWVAVAAGIPSGALTGIGVSSASSWRRSRC